MRLAVPVGVLVLLVTALGLACGGEQEYSPPSPTRDGVDGEAPTPQHPPAATPTSITLPRRGGVHDPAVTRSTIDQAFEDLPREMQKGNTLGRDEAPVRLIQFEDFQCAHCLTYSGTIEPFLVEEYVKPGLLQIEFAHNPVVGQESVTAAVSAHCAGEQNRMFEYANRLFARQLEDGFRADSGAFSEGKLVELAEALGLDGDAFATCQASAEALSAVARDLDRAREYGSGGADLRNQRRPAPEPSQDHERVARPYRGGHRHRGQAVDRLGATAGEACGEPASVAGNYAGREIYRCVTLESGLVTVRSYSPSAA